MLLGMNRKQKNKQHNIYIYIYYKASSEGDDYVQYVEVPSHADRVQLHVKFDGPSG